jgi:hypothetical protein
MGKVVDARKLMGIGIVLFIIGIGGIMSCNDTNSVIVVEGPTEVLSEAECSFSHGKKVIAVLNKGESARIIGVRYPKACMVYKIKLADGRIGYVTHGDNFKVIEDQKK